MWAGGAYRSTSPLPPTGDRRRSLGVTSAAVILRCPSCHAIVQQTDEICPICEYPVPPESRDPNLVEQAAPALAPAPDVAVTGRMVVRGLAVLGWASAIVMVLWAGSALR